MNKVNDGYIDDLEFGKVVAKALRASVNAGPNVGRKELEEKSDVLKGRSRQELKRSKGL